MDGLGVRKGTEDRWGSRVLGSGGDGAFHFFIISRS